MLLYPRERRIPPNLVAEAAAARPQLLRRVGWEALLCTGEVEAAQGVVIAQHPPLSLEGLVEIVVCLPLVVVEQLVATVHRQLPEATGVMVILDAVAKVVGEAELPLRLRQRVLMVVMEEPTEAAVVVVAAA